MPAVISPAICVIKIICGSAPGIAIHAVVHLCMCAQDLKKERGWQLDARLLAYAWGLQHSQDWNVGG